MNHQGGYKTIDRFRPKDQDIIRALASLMSAEDFPFLGLQRQGFSGVELPPPNQSVKMRLVEAGHTGDISGQERWPTSAFSEKDVSIFLKTRLEEAKYSIFLEVLGLDRADMLQAFTEGARQILRNLDNGLHERLVRMSGNVVEMFVGGARGRCLVTWLCHTKWGGAPARAALRDYQQVEFEASLEAFKTMESGHYNRLRARRDDPYITPEEFVILASCLCQGVLVDRAIAGDLSDGSDVNLMGRALTSLMVWVLCRDDADPTIHDLLGYMQGASNHVEFGDSQTLILS